MDDSEWEYERGSDAYFLNLIETMIIQTPDLLNKDKHFTTQEKDRKMKWKSIVTDGKCVTTDIIDDFIEKTMAFRPLNEAEKLKLDAWINK